MDGRSLAVFAVLMATVFSSPVQTTKNGGLRTALDAYVNWGMAVSAAFERKVNSSQLQKLDDIGSSLHNDVMVALNEKIEELGSPIDIADVKTKVVANIGNSLVLSVGKTQLLTLLVGASQTENHGARIAVSSKLFQKLTDQLKALAADLSTNVHVDSKKLEEIVEGIIATDIAFDTIVDNFKKVLQSLPLYVVSSDDDGSEVQTLVRTKRQVIRPPLKPGPINMGGGFRTDLRSVTFNRRDTTVQVKPHFQFSNGPRITGGEVNLEQKFRNGRVFGGASYDRFNGQPNWEFRIGAQWNF